MTKRLPQTIFAKLETDSNGISYIVADKEIYGMVQPGEKIRIGVYKLVETTEAEMLLSTSKTTKVKRA